MKTNIFKKITIKQANILTVIAIFLVSLIFVVLLVDEMYYDYEGAMQQSFEYPKTELLDRVQVEEKLKSILIKTILTIVTLSFIIFAISMGFYKILGILLQDDTESFMKFFEKASKGKESLNPDMMFFEDFKLLATYANKMVETINDQKFELQDLNKDLENRVHLKTQSLDKLLASQRQFLRYTVHETNTPLSVILTSIELYTMKNKKDRQLLKIEAAVKNIFNIYDDLSYLVKKEQVEYPKVAINIGKYIDTRIEFFSDVAQMSKVEFSYVKPTKEIYVFFNETKLQRIVDNNITNAIKYTLADEVIDVDIKQVGSNVRFCISSKSKAIKDIDKVFDGFYREEKDGDGFGLGLQMVRNICDEENVSISVSSDKNKTVFTYMFKMMGE